MKKVEKDLDDAWSKLVKLRAGNCCEYCGNTKSLNSHHIFSRGKKSTRWDVNNGICLCVAHHIGSGFSAHKTPLPFARWLIEKRGESWYDLLNYRSNQTYKAHDFEKEILLNELRKEIKQYENNKIQSIKRRYV